MHPRSNRSRVLSTLAAAVVAASGCKAVAPAFGANPYAARQNADEFFYSVSSRFSNIQRSPKLVRARQQFGRYALVPSGVFNDSSVWMSMGSAGAAGGGDSTRLFADDGYVTPTQYIVVAHSSSEPPRDLAESREVVRLRHLSEDEYEWATDVNVAIGHVGAEDIANVLAAGLRAAEGRTPAANRTDYRTNFPRTTAALGKLFSFDTLLTRRDTEGATTLDLAIHLTPDTLARAMPAYAKYIDKYVRTGHYRLIVRDRGGARWLEASADDYWMHFHLRTRDGHFAPLDGPMRPMPENLLIDLSLRMKILFFTVGFQKMTGELNVIHVPHERGYALRFYTEPEWILPPTVHYFLKTPLARPFQGRGIPVSFGVRDNPGAQTILNRRAGLVVQESGILRFLNKLSGTAVGDFLGPAEREANRFNTDVFRALRADVGALLE